ncbi:type IVB secretion system protein IcmW [Roseomonas mucosa]|uniref:type IVB secretion system protein IcmW n=2 Tax=Roseomonas mucosa TaxID=207340 RepID=UPI00324CEAE5
MPDLERDGVLEWVRRAEPAVAAMVAGLILPVEDDPAVLPLLTAFGQHLDKDAGGGGSLAGLFTDEGLHLREAMAQLGVARLLRLLAWFDEAPVGRFHPWPEALLRDETTEAGACLRAMLAALHRQTLLERLFAPARLQLLAEVLGETRREAA